MERLGTGSEASSSSSSSSSPTLTFSENDIIQLERALLALSFIELSLRLDDPKSAGELWISDFENFFDEYDDFVLDSDFVTVPRELSELTITNQGATDMPFLKRVWRFLQQDVSHLLDSFATTDQLDGSSEYQLYTLGLF